MSIKASILSLGCARNLVDSEVMLGILKKSGCDIVDITDGADIAIINTCSFIEDAKKESIDIILDVIDLKRENKLKKILIAGCLPQRYGKILKDEFKEIDGFIGADGFRNLPRIISALTKNRRVFNIPPAPKFLYDDRSPRIRLTPKHYAYLKISEGCSHKCSFCVIPCVRGRHRSRKMDSVLREAAALIKSGVKEINLIGQDTTLYGMDLYKRLALAELLKKLARVKGVNWIRLLYTHPAHFTDELIKVIRDETAVCKYIDLPIQHISDKILKKMNRGTTRKSILDLLHKIRKSIPGVVIRTSIIVGFPGETDKEFSELVGFIKKEKFERLGAFTYSREEGTAAYKFADQIPEKEKKARWDEIMRVQQDVSRQNNRKLMGKVLDV
ncbi:MAG: 30S ribosomal protein S12 methylthiotransferase RimO, partial [Candidatus Omnitrophota bacterium]|nr:30S ribosomal protein S12 methylthiotransferase RimO [Candidatus Omnitrophota bacterium]